MRDNVGYGSRLRLGWIGLDWKEKNGGFNFKFTRSIRIHLTVYRYIEKVGYRRLNVKKRQWWHTKKAQRQAMTARFSRSKYLTPQVAVDQISLLHFTQLAIISPDAILPRYQARARTTSRNVSIRIIEQGRWRRRADWSCTVYTQYPWPWQFGK